MERMRKVLIEWINYYRSGKYSTIYIPFMYPLKPMPTVVSLLSLDPEKAYSRIGDFIADLKLRYRYGGSIAGVYGEKWQKCYEMAREEVKHEAWGFVERLFTRNDMLLVDVLDFLHLHVHSDIAVLHEYVAESYMTRICYPADGRIRLDVSMAQFVSAYRRCREVIGSRNMQSIYRFLEDAMIATGATAYRKTILGRGRASLFATPLTVFLRRVLTEPFGLDDYINALRDLNECIVSGFIDGKDPLGLAEEVCPKRLEKYRIYSIDMEPRVWINTVAVVWRLLHDLLKGW